MNDNDQASLIAELRNEVASLKQQLTQARIDHRLAATAARLAQQRVDALERTVTAVTRVDAALKSPAAKGVPPALRPGRPAKLTRPMFVAAYRLRQHSHWTAPEIAKTVGMSEQIVRRFLDRTYQSPEALAAYDELGLQPKSYDEVVAERESRASVEPK